jgi:hypothetical protein
VRSPRGLESASEMAAIALLFSDPRPFLAFDPPNHEPPRGSPICFGRGPSENAGRPNKKYKAGKQKMRGGRTKKCEAAEQKLPHVLWVCKLKARSNDVLNAIVVACPHRKSRFNLRPACWSSRYVLTGPCAAHSSFPGDSAVHSSHSPRGRFIASRRHCKVLLERSCASS